MSNFNLCDGAFAVSNQLLKDCEHLIPTHTTVSQRVSGRGKSAAAAASAFMAMLATITGSHSKNDVFELACAPQMEKLGGHADEWRVEGTLITRLLPTGDDSCMVARANMADRKPTITEVNRDK